MIIKGDITQNGKIDYEDLVVLRTYYERNMISQFTGQQFWAADIDNDGSITTLDYQEIWDMLRGLEIINEIYYEEGNV